MVGVAREQQEALAEFGCAATSVVSPQLPPKRTPTIDYLPATFDTCSNSDLVIAHRLTAGLELFEQWLPFTRVELDDSCHRSDTLLLINQLHRDHA